MTRKPLLALAAAVVAFVTAGAAATAPRPGVDWPSFRGIKAAGVADGFPTLAMWDVPKKLRPNFLSSITRALMMLAVAGAAVVLSTVLSGLAAAASGFGVWAKIGGVAGATVLNIGIFLLAFRILTVAKVSWRDVLPGAIIAGVAWEVLLLSGTYLVGHQIKNASAIYGVFALVIGLLWWLKIGAQVTLYAAEINVVRNKHLYPRSMREPPSDADEVTLHRDRRPFRARSAGIDTDEEVGIVEERKAEATPEATPKEFEEQSTPQLVRSIASDTSTLVRKEVELAKHEITEGLVARIKAAGAFGAAGLFGFFGMLFGLIAAFAALTLVVAPWLAGLIVMGSMFVLAGGAAVFGLLRAKRPPLAPTETVRTVKEDVEWARAQLKR